MPSSAIWQRIFGKSNYHMKKFFSGLAALAATTSLSACATGPAGGTLDALHTKNMNYLAAYIGETDINEVREADFCDKADDVYRLASRGEPDDFVSAGVINRARELKPLIVPELRRRGFRESEIKRLHSDWENRDSGFRVGDRRKFASCAMGKRAFVAHASSYGDTMYEYGDYTYVWFSGNGNWPNARVKDWSQY